MAIIEIKKPSLLTDDRPEGKVYGRAAVDALFQSRPQDIFRVYIETELVKEFGPLLKHCSRKKMAYHIVTNEDLNKISKSVHHEGVMILAKMPHTVTDREFLRKISRQTVKTPILYLDGIGNPHNIGAIIRTAAHFGVSHLIGQEVNLPRTSPSMARVAEGGLEHINIINLRNAEQTLESLKSIGYKLIGTSSHSDNSLYGLKLDFPPVFVLGSEVYGMSKKIEQLCDYHINIPGTGAVESLNVSVACGLLLGEYARQQIQ